MPKFLYELDDLQFFDPWTRPDIYRLKLCYNDLKNELDITGINFTLFGGFWSSEWRQSWDVDLFVEMYNRSFLDLTDGEKIHLYQVIKRFYHLAISKYRFLIDITISRALNQIKVFDFYKLVEPPSVYTPTVSRDEAAFSIFRRVKKTMDDKVIFDIIAADEHIESVGDSTYFVHKSGEKKLMKQISKIGRGRVYYPPKTLEEIF